MKGKIQLRSDIVRQRCLAGTWHNLVLPKLEAASLQSPAKASMFQNIFSPYWTPCSSLLVAPQEKSFASPAPISLIPLGRRLQLQLLSLGARRISLAVAEDTTGFNTSHKSAPGLFPGTLAGKQEPAPNVPQTCTRCHFLQETSQGQCIQ